MGNRRDKSQKISSDDKLEMRRRAEALSQSGEHEKACAVLEELARISPKNPMIWNDLGVEYAASGEMEKAFASLKRGVDVYSSYPLTLYNLGKLAVDLSIGLEGAERKELLAEAVRSLNASLDLDAENAFAHFYLAVAYRVGGEEKLADAHMSVARRLDSGLEVPLGWKVEGAAAGWVMPGLLRAGDRQA